MAGHLCVLISSHGAVIRSQPQLLLASDWLQVIRADPRLPAEHLPADSQAAKAESLFVELDRAVE